MRRNDESDNEENFEDYGLEDEQGSPDEDEGGSSQDHYESDFINDGKEEIEGEEHQEKKG